MRTGWICEDVHRSSLLRLLNSKDRGSLASCDKHSSALDSSARRKEQYVREMGGRICVDIESTGSGAILQEFVMFRDIRLSIRGTDCQLSIAAKCGHRGKTRISVSLYESKVLSNCRVFKVYRIWNSKSTWVVRFPLRWLTETTTWESYCEALRAYFDQLTFSIPAVTEHRTPNSEQRTANTEHCGLWNSTMYFTVLYLASMITAMQHARRCSLFLFSEILQQLAARK